MKNEVKKFLEFNGKTIFFVSVDGQYWIAIKPICEALKIDYINQFKNLKEDKILSQLLSEQTIVAADRKLRKMVCLPEFFIYGWIFSIQSQSEELQQYKLECYRILFNYFHGTITQRQNILKEKTLLDFQIEELERKITSTDDYRRLAELRKKKNKAKTKLLKLDNEIIEQQLDLWKSN